MTGKMFKAAIAFALVTSVISLQSPQSANAAEGDFDLTIMHTNDTHANLDKIANRATLVKQIRAENANNLLLDAGDVFSGTLYFNAFEGAADLDFMNLLQYDAMTFGNHEFDLGASAEGHAELAEFVGGADFPFVAANVNFAADANLSPLENDVYTADYANGEIYNGIIKEIDGEEVGIFGLTTEETAAISSPGDVEFTNYIEAAKGAVQAFQTAGVDKIIALTHIGYNDSKAYDNDLLLAEAVAGIDVIVGGHTHTKLEKPVVYNGHQDPIVIVQANEYNKFLGQLDVTFNAAGVVTTYEGVLHDVNASNIVPDADAAEKLAPYAAEIETLKNTSTGAEALVELDGSRGLGGVRAGETNLGNLITDGMLATAKGIDPDTVIALQNGGGIRASIDAGDITMGEVLTVMPFGNALAIMNLTGAEIRTALEHSVREYPNENGGFLQVSGLQFTFDPKKAAGSRVTEVNVVNGDTTVPLDNAANYKVATNTFTAKGGDGYEVFGNAYAEGRVSEPGNVDYEMFVDYLTTLEEVNPTVENRINALIPFADVAESYWAYPYVTDLYKKEIINGTSAVTFSPLKSLSRSEAVTILTRVLKLDTENAVDAPFTDIKNMRPERRAEINAAYAAGIINGVSNNEFMPNLSISRAHFAMMLHRVYEKENGNYEVTEFAPYQDYGGYNNEAKEAITVLYELEIATGDNSNNFLPSKFTNRAETAKMISKFLPYVTE